MLVLKTHTGKENWAVYPWVLYVRLSGSSLVPAFCLQIDERSLGLAHPELSTHGASPLHMS